MPSSAAKEVSAASLTASSHVPVQAPIPKIALRKAGAASEPLEEGGDFPSMDRVHQFFTTGPMQFPIVETIVYDSHVPWLKGRPAWIADYAVHYGTSRHFIARSLNGRPDYFSQKVSRGSKFNVFRKDRNFQFYLLVDLALCKMGFYYIDLDTNERVLVKTYKVGLGKLAAGGQSLTPVGKFVLGNKIAVYRPGIMGHFQDKQVEMIRIFGTRWLPFEQEIGEAVLSSAVSRGLGIQGAPWEVEEGTGRYIEKKETVGKYDSDGCIRLAAEDLEELFAIVVTRPTIVEIVQHLKDARKLPGVEVASPKR